MFYADPVAAFTNVGQSMAAGSRMCLATWQPLLENEWIVVPGGVLLRFGSMPDAGAGPGMFAQSEPDVVTGVLDAAGFAGIELVSTALRLRVGSDVDSAIEHLTDSGPTRAVLDTVPAADREAALTALAEALEEHTDDDGVHLGASIWLVHATR
jgi:hypothetical protein